MGQDLDFCKKVIEQAKNLIANHDKKKANSILVEILRKWPFGETAIIMKKLNVDYMKSIELIKFFNGSLRLILNEHRK